MPSRDNHFAASFRYLNSLVIVFGLINAIDGTPNRGFYKQQKSRESFQSLTKEKDVQESYDFARFPKQHVKDCMLVTSEVGFFTYVHNSSTSDGTVCGIYFLAQPDHNIEVIFSSFNVPCKNDDLVSFVDGWELNGQYFPSPVEHHLSLSNRLNEFCGAKVDKTFVSSQNAALIQYRISHYGRGFTVFVRHVKNQYPCNAIVDTTTDDIPFKLRNYKQHLNCTLIALYPCVVRVTDLKLANIESLWDENVIHKCDESNDKVVIGGTNGVDTSSLETFKNVCKLKAGRDETIVVGCGVTAVKLVSSGLRDNFATVRIRKINEEDNILKTGLFCDLLE